MSRLILTEAAFPAERLAAATRPDDRVITIGHLSSTEAVAALALPPEESWRLWERAYALAQGWYRGPQGDPTLFRDISLGCIIEIEMWYVWRELLEDLELLRRALAAFSPDRVLLATFRNRRLAALLAALGGPPADSLAPPLPARLRRPLRSEMRVGVLKELEVDRHVRLLALAMGQRRQALPAPAPIETLAVLEVPGSYYAESLLPVLAHIPQSAVLLLDQRHAARVAAAGLPGINFSAWLAPHLGSLAGEMLRWQRAFREMLPALRAAARDGDVNLWPACAPRLARVFAYKLPIVAAEVLAAERLLRAADVRSLLLNTDAHHGSRLLTLVGQRLGVPALVVQHGATIGPWGYLPIHAERFAAWGEASRRWMLAHGARAEQLTVTGQPRFDRLVARPAVDRLALGLPIGRLLVLWALDPLPVAENRAILDLLLAAVAATPGVTIVARPHPNLHDLGWLMEKAAGREDLLFSPAEHNLHDLIGACDAVLIQGSTVGIEALALDRPVIVFPADHLSSFASSYDTTAVLRARTSAELATLLRALGEPGGEDAGLAHERRRFVADYLHALDGRSAERVAAELRALAGASVPADLTR